MADNNFKPTPEMFEGMMAPVYCPRQRQDCESLDFIIAENHASFVCCGEHAGNSDIPADKYRVCFKNAIVDDMQDYDKRDITHAAKVLLGALAIIEERAARPKTSLIATTGGGNG